MTKHRVNIFLLIVVKILLSGDRGLALKKTIPVFDLNPEFDRRWVYFGHYHFNVAFNSHFNVELSFEYGIQFTRNWKIILII